MSAAAGLRRNVGNLGQKEILNAHAIVTLGRPQLSGELRIGAVVDKRITAWESSVLRVLAQETAIRLEHIFVNDASSFSTRPALWGVYERWSSHADDPFHLLDPSALLPEVPRSSAALLGADRQLTPGAHRLLASKQLDVLLWLAEEPSGGDCSGVSRFGVWRFRAGDPAQKSWDPAYFRQAYQRELVSELLILAHVKSFDEGAVIFRDTAATIEGWRFARNAKMLLDRAGVFLLRRLLDVLQFGPAYFCERISSATVRCDGSTAAYPPISVLFRYLLRQVGRSLLLRYQRRGRAMQWFTAVRWNQEAFTRCRERFTSSHLHELMPNPRCTEADPFVIEHGGEHFLLFEEVPAGCNRGRISFRKIQQDLTSTPPVPVLQPPYHISYPFLIQDRGQLFMIPETSANRTVELYRCTDFPQQWRLEKILCEGVALVDTTAFWDGDTWFFFTTCSDSGELLLFYSDQLAGEWYYHRANPISTHVRNARSAGALFRRGNRLIRPAQDASAGYGHAITLNEVTALSRSEYAEHIVETIYPTWSKGLLGTHTLNANDYTEVMDVLRYRE
jgi:hypothetical protein